MKVCNLESTGTIEDAVHAMDFICKERPQVVIAPSFPWIRKSLLTISRASFQAETDEALLRLQELKKHCIEFISTLMNGKKDSEIFERATEEIELRFTGMTKLVDEAMTMLNDHELMISGEYLSSILITSCLKYRGIQTVLLDSSEFMQTGSDGKPDSTAITEKVNRLMELCPAETYIIQSCLCKDAYGETGHLKYGGSELYAAYIASAFHADELILWLPTKELYTQSGDIIYRQQKNCTLTFDEAAGIINAGIRLLSPSCLELACQNNILIHLMEGWNGEQRSITIGTKQTEHNVRAVAARKNLNYIRLHTLGILPSIQFLEKSMAVFTKYKVPVYLITSTMANISIIAELSIDTLYLIQREISSFAELVVENNVSSICVLGQFDWDKTCVEEKVLYLLKEIPVLMISYGSDNSSMSVAVRECDREKALCLLSDAFLGTQFADGTTPHVFHGNCNAFIV